MAMTISRRGLVAALALGASVLTAAGASAQDKPTTIVVYNAQHANLTQAWVDAFTKETGIKVTLRQGSDLEMANQIIQEGANSPADVFLTENSPAMNLLTAANMFAPVPADILALVPDGYKPSDGKWVAVAARSTVFAYNKKKLTADKLPKTMDELADPKWKGRWAASPSGADFQAIVAAYLDLKGEAATVAWLKGMKQNVKVYRGNGAAMKGANLGEVDGALIYHYYYFGDQAKTGENSNDVALHYFRNKDPGAFVSLSGGGILASSKNKEAAARFLKFVVGKGGQDILRTGDSFEYAVGIGAQSNPKLEPLAKLDAPRIDAAKLHNKKVADLMMAAGLL
jgi:iron(III) transport system substrate-binding protein